MRLRRGRARLHTPDELIGLQASEERLRAFMHHSPLMAFMKDDAGRYVYANPRMEREFGISVEDIYGKADVDWLPAEIARTVRENDRTVLASQQTLEVIETVPGRDGEPRHWLVNKFPFTNAAGERFVAGVAMDVSSLKRAEARLKESEERYRHLVDNSQGLICTHDTDGRLLSVNPAALRSLGYEASEVIGRSLGDILSPAVRPHFPRYLERIMSSREDDGLMLVVTKAGAIRTWRYHNVCIGDDPRHTYILGHAQDVTELRDAQQQLQTLAVTDELTGLLNRRGFFGRGSRLLQSCTSAHLEVTAFYIDVDGLKDINDVFGHDAGSATIVAAADALRNTFRAADILARVGGDEFVVLGQLAAATTPLIRRRLDEHTESIGGRAGLPAPLALSVGAAHLQPGQSTTLEDLVRLADADMYEHKRSKRR